MRCLALAQAWQDQLGPVVFATASCPAALVARLHEENIEHHVLAAAPGSVEDAKATCKLMHELEPAWCVLDGYQFDSSYQKTLVDTGTPLVVMDDFAHASPYSAAIILNQNLDAHAGLYGGLCGSGDSNTRVLAGAPFAMLRREFTRYIESTVLHEVDEHEVCKGQLSLPQRVLVTLGGSDPGNVSSMVLAGLGQVLDSSHEVTLVVNGSHAHLPALKKQLEAAPYSGRLVSDVKDMAELMRWADMAISAAGSTCWELAFMGVPAVLVAVAENQLPLAKAMVEHNAAVYAGQRAGESFGEGEQLTISSLAKAAASIVTNADRFNTMKQNARKLIDGKGTLRVLAAMKNSALRLRLATPDDARMLWQWRTDPATQASAFQTDPIPYDAHVKWLKARLASEDTSPFIALNELDEPVGQIRFDICSDNANGDHAEIDVTIAPSHRGKRLAWRLIRLASQQQKRLTPHIPLVAYIKQENTASQKSFVAAGYVQTGQENKHDQQVLRYEWQ